MMTLQFFDALTATPSLLMSNVIGNTMSSKEDPRVFGTAMTGINNSMDLNNSMSTFAPEKVFEEKKSILISKNIRDIIIIINMAFLCQIISVFGVFANIINIIVFTKQGFRDAMTMTLTGLAVADLGIATCAVWLCICYNPLFQQLKLPFLPLQIVYLTAGLPRLSCSRASSCILALATFERCLCIAMPFKVREIITPRRCLIFIIGVFITMTASVVPIYYTSRTAQKYDEAANRSYLVLSFTEDREKVDSIAFAIGVTLSVCSFVAVAVCTVVLVYSLKQACKWRESAMATGKDKEEKDIKRRAEFICEISSDASNKTSVTTTETGENDYRGIQSTSGTLTTVEMRKTGRQNVLAKTKRASKMVSLISTIFIICYLPNTMNQLVMSLVPEFAKNGRYINTNQVSWSIGFVFESFNCSVNIFMYYTMSTKYRETIQSLICSRCRKPGGSGKPASENDVDQPKLEQDQNYV